MPYDHDKKLQRFSLNKKRYAHAWASEAEGNAWEAAAKLAIAQGRPIPGIDAEALGAKRTVGGRDADTVQNCLRSATNLRWKPKGEGASKQILNAEIFVRWCGTNVPASEAFSQDKLESFIEYLQNERRVGNNTINKYLSAVRTMMEFAKLDEEPELPWFALAQGRTRVFTDEECAMIEKQWRLWGRAREADFLVFLLHTGGRPYIDAARLHWQNVFNPAGGHPAVHFIQAKGGNARTVPLTPEAWEAVQRQSRDQSGPWAWANKDDMRRLWDKTVSAFPQLQDAVLYTARHTFGTNLYRRSRDIKLVKDMMGHKNISTTEIYVHIVGQDSYAQVAELMSARPKLQVVNGNT